MIDDSAGRTMTVHEIVDGWIRLPAIGESLDVKLNTGEILGGVMTDEGIVYAGDIGERRIVAWRPTALKTEPQTVEARER